MKILIVDDNPDARTYLERALAAEGFAIDTASNGIEALASIRRSRPDMVISDILMPGMDGYELCRRIKTDDRFHKIPFVFYTATYTDSEDERLALSLGASKFIVKPMEIESLLSLINETLDEYRDEKLTIPEHVKESDEELTRRQVYSLAKKLDKKVRELQMERRMTREKEDLINLLLYSTAEAIYSVDLEGNCVFCNPVCVRLLGYSSPDELKGKNMHALIHHSRPDGSPYRDIDCRIYNAFRSGQEAHVDNEVFWRKDGSSFPVEYWSYPVKRDGGITGAVITFIDITERKKLELQLLQAQKMEAIGQLAGGIAHDFNNLLSAIVNYLYLVEKKSQRKDDIRNDLSQITSLVLRASEIIKGLLAFSRKSIINLQPLSINNCISSMGKMLRKFIGEDIELEIRLSENDPVIMADHIQIEQIIMNLVTNARDAMPDGGLLTITTETVDLDRKFTESYKFGEPGSYVLLTVSDTGTGMNEETRKRIFDPFFTTKDPGKGSGLGLSIIYGLIKQHKGQVNVYSEPGKGTSFKIYFPLSMAKVSEESKGEYEDLTGNGETILLAEDEKELRISLSDILENSGYHVIAAEDGEDAVRIFKQHHDSIDLLIIDVVMPKLSGTNAYKKISSIKPDTKVLFTSGYMGEHVEKRGILPDSANFIVKPIIPDQLLKKIKTILK